MPISILFPSTEQPPLGSPSEATADLRLDQVIETIAAPRAEYDLAAFFFTPLTSPDDVRFRQAIFRDVDSAELRTMLDEFAEGMRSVRRLLTGLAKLHSRRQQQAWFLDAADRYCRTIDALAAGLEAADITSAGLCAIRDYLIAATASDAYERLRTESANVLTALQRIRYCLTVAGSRVIVRPFEGDADYSERVLDTFERFRQRDVEPISLPAASIYMNHVDAQVLDLVARLHPDEFAALDTFCTTHRDFVDETVTRFDREIQFYVAASDFMRRLRAAGLPVCFPDVAEHDRTIDAHDIYDVALADKLIREHRDVVVNDLELRESERIIVVTGPNQGGKTTFARTFGQLHHLAALGCPTPGTRVRLGLFDRLETHFERTEDLRTLSGKLEDELVRVRRILERATSRSVVVMNESFGSTSLRDSALLGGAILQQLIELDVRAVYVTFVDELSRLGPSVVSMVGTVAEDDPSVRTYKIVRRRADGRAYAASLAEQHGLTARKLKERIGA